MPNTLHFIAWPTMWLYSVLSLTSDIRSHIHVTVICTNIRYIHRTWQLHAICNRWLITVLNSYLLHHTPLVYLRWHMRERERQTAVPSITNLLSDDCTPQNYKKKKLFFSFLVWILPKFKKKIVSKLLKKNYKWKHKVKSCAKVTSEILVKTNCSR